MPKLHIYALSDALVVVFTFFGFRELGGKARTSEPINQVVNKARMLVKSTIVTGDVPGELLIKKCPKIRSLMLWALGFGATISLVENLNKLEGLFLNTVLVRMTGKQATDLSNTICRSLPNLRVFVAPFTFNWYHVAQIGLHCPLEAVRLRESPSLHGDQTHLDGMVMMFKNCPNLTVLNYAGYFPHWDQVLQTLKRPPPLSYLRTNLTNADCMHITHLFPRLRHLHMPYSCVSDQGITVLAGRLQYLEDLDIYDTAVTPSFFMKLSQDQKLGSRIREIATKLDIIREILPNLITSRPEILITTQRLGKYARYHAWLQELFHDFYLESYHAS